MYSPYVCPTYVYVACIWMCHKHVSCKYLQYFMLHLLFKSINNRKNRKNREILGDNLLMADPKNSSSP
jgi:hypothetical protein